MARTLEEKIEIFDRLLARLDEVDGVPGAQHGIYDIPEDPLHSHVNHPDPNIAALAKKHKQLGSRKRIPVLDTILARHALQSALATYDRANKG